MSILNMFGGDLGPGGIQDIISDPEKVRQFLPIIVNLAETFKQADEHSVMAMISFEDGAPILRVVSTKLVKIETGEQILILNRNIKAPDGTDLKFNLLELLSAQNEQKEE